MGGKEDGEFKLLLIVIYWSSIDQTWYVGLTAYISKLSLHRLSRVFQTTPFIEQYNTFENSRTLR